MDPKLTPFILPYTRAELPGWGRLMNLVVGGKEADSEAKWKALPAVFVRGKNHKYLMKLDRSDWAQRITYFIGRYYELGVLRTIDLLLRPGDRFIDIGANIGMITLHARSLVGASGRVDCFEPNPQCVEAIREHLRINGIENVVVHPCALAETPGSLFLNLTSEHSGTATLAYVGNQAIRTIRVDVRVGDHVIEGAPRLIKIDVEGFELHALKGLTHTLERHRPFLITELIEGHLVRAGTSVAEVSEFLFGLGYAAYRIEIERRNWRHHLSLDPLADGGNLSRTTDVLWAHPDASSNLTQYVRAGRRQVPGA